MIHRVRIGIALAIAVILVATLPPTGAAFPVIGLFGARALADITRNIILFAPLGAALTPLGWRGRRVVLAAAVLSASVEVAQLVIPGRDPSPIDLLANALGAAIGHLLVRSFPRWRHADGPLAPVLATAGVVLAVLAYAAGPVLFVRWPINAAYFSQWTPNLAHLGVYRGRILAASLGPERLPPGLVRHSPTVMLLLRAGIPLRLTVVAGPAPDRLADVFSIYDHLQREIILVGAEGEDLILRQRLLAAQLGLDNPELRVPGAFAPYGRGDTLTITITGAARGMCVAMDGQERCGLGHTAGDGWSLVWYPREIPAWGQSLLGWLWIAAFAFPGAYYVSWIWLLPALAPPVGALLLAPRWAHQPPTSAEEWAAFAAAIALARLAGSRSRRRMAHTST